VSVIKADGYRIDDARSAVWVIYQELKRLADAARSTKK
jgi:hypothetical protein